MDCERHRGVCVDVDAGHVVDLLVVQTLEMIERAQRRPSVELEGESGVAPVHSLGFREDPFAFGVDASTSPREVVGRRTWLGVGQIELRTVEFLVPLGIDQAIIAVGSVGVDGVAQLWW